MAIAAVPSAHAICGFFIRTTGRCSTSANTWHQMSLFDAPPISRISSVDGFVFFADRRVTCSMPQRMLYATPSMAARQRSALVVSRPMLKTWPRRYGLLMGERSPKSQGDNDVVGAGRRCRGGGIGSRISPRMIFPA